VVKIAGSRPPQRDAILARYHQAVDAKSEMDEAIKNMPMIEDSELLRITKYAGILHFDNIFDAGVDEIINRVNKDPAKKQLITEITNHVPKQRDAVLENYYLSKFEDEEYYEALESACEREGVPYFCPISQGIIREVAEVKTGDEEPHYYDMAGINKWAKQNRTDPLTRLVITSIESKPELTAKLKEIIKNIFENVNYYADQVQCKK